MRLLGLWDGIEHTPLLGSDDAVGDKAVVSLELAHRDLRLGPEDAVVSYAELALEHFHKLAVHSTAQRVAANLGAGRTAYERARAPLAYFLVFAALGLKYFDSKYSSEAIFLWSMRFYVYRSLPNWYGLLLGDDLLFRGTTFCEDNRLRRART